MKKLLIVLSFVIAGSCCSRPDTFEYEKLDEFIELGKSYGHSFSRCSIEFVDDNDSEKQGKNPYRSNKSEGRIYLDKTTELWEHCGEIAKEIAIFHELGHFFLDRKHTEERLENGIDVKSIMYPTLSCHTAYLDRPDLRTYYLNELFANRGK